jgi:hypothetical protein
MIRWPVGIGEVLWLKVKEDDLKSKYERQIKPDPSRYYLKGIPDYSHFSRPKIYATKIQKTN